jgi:hypothetical protein
MNEPVDSPPPSSEARKARLLRELLGPRPEARAGVVDLIAVAAIAVVGTLAVFEAGPPRGETAVAKGPHDVRPAGLVVPAPAKK